VSGATAGQAAALARQPRPAGPVSAVTASSAGVQLAFDLVGQRQLDITAIHQATGIYTAAREVGVLLDKLGWPAEGTRLLDPGAGDGAFLVAALSRLNLPADEPDEAARRVRGYEFYDGAAGDARWSVRRHLTGRGWSHAAAVHASRLIVEERDYLLDPVPAGEHDVIAANPPYWRLARLPPGYRLDYELAVPADARADLLYARTSAAQRRSSGRAAGSD
jgi:hypothetical protein